MDTKFYVNLRDMKKWLVIGILAVTSLSCQWVRKLSDGASELLGDEVIARVGEHKLFRSDLEKILPGGLEAEDSISLARQYIYSWAEDLLLLDMAEGQLSKTEKDVSKELEEYRRSLLKYRYQEHYVTERLDTSVTPEQIQAYYEAHPDKFVLDHAVVKCRILIIPSSSKSIKPIRKLMGSSDAMDLAEADSLSRMAAIRYLDASESWMDALQLAREMGTDYNSIAAALRRGDVEFTDEADNLHYAHIVEIVREGKTAPLEFVSGRIRDILLNTRKHTLTTALERDLLERARNNGSFVIY